MILSVVMVTAGAVVLGDAALTLAWKEPVSSLYGQLKQNEAASQLDELQTEFLASTPAPKETKRPVDPVQEARKLAKSFQSRLQTGKPIGRIQIPSTGVDFVVIEGTDTASLKKGPGHYPDTALPGEGKTIGVAGHRTTYLAPFRNIDKINQGDEVRIDMPYATFTYKVTDTKIVEPTATQIVDDVGRERLVLTACHPLYSAAQRYVVFADLADVQLKRG